ncbi:MAG: DNA polymerase [Candidatus Bilamarchaeaceae archaeon]
MRKGDYAPIDGEAIDNIYTLLGTDNDYIWRDTGISTEEAFWFLIKRPQYVGYYIHFDIIHILKDLWPYEFSKWQKYKHWKWIYYPRKLFILRNLRSNRQTRIYDISGFCQSSFLAACKEWDVSLPEIVEKGKQQRSLFTYEDKEFMIAYNRAECVALIELFRRIRDSCPYRLRSWHGAGAIASQMVRRHKLHTHSSYTLDVLEAAKNSYYGGRIELTKVGTLSPTYVYDIRSAYPFALSQLPSLTRWYRVKRYEPEGTGWYLVRYSAPYDTYVGGLPVRGSHGIGYPLLACGWYTSYEVAQVLDHVEVLDGWVTFNQDRPYSVIEELYHLRAEYREKGEEGKSRMIKLGLNSIYGKFAQREGGRFTDFGVASLITGRIRAMLYQACNDESLIAYATDSIVSSKRLDLPIGKGLGQWEERVFSRSTFLQPGIYQHDDLKPKVRGMPGLDVIEAARVISEGKRYSTPLQLFVTPQLHSIRKSLAPYTIIRLDKYIDIVTKKREWLFNGKIDLLSRYYDSVPHVTIPTPTRFDGMRIELDVIM